MTTLNPRHIWDHAAEGLGLGCALLLLLAPVRLGAQTRFTKGEALRQTAAAVLQPAHRDLRDRCLDLERSVSELSVAATPEAWRKARDAWRDAMLAARRVQCYQAGPIVERDAASSFFSWRLFPARIEAAVASSHPIDAAWIDQMGVGTKGLFACEYLLFDRAPPAAAGAAAAAGEAALPSRTNAFRRLQYLVALTRDLAQKAGAVSGDWGRSGDDSASARFAAGGQETLNRLINQMAATLESIAEEHLNFVLQLPTPIVRQLDRIENSASGASLQALSARLEGLRALYRGGTGPGIDDYLRQLNPALHQRVEQQFNETLAALQSVGAPLEQAVMTRKESLQGAHRAVRDLELLFKVDLASALGVTITFSSNDGD